MPEKADREVWSSRDRPGRESCNELNDHFCNAWVSQEESVQHIILKIMVLQNDSIISFMKPLVTCISAADYNICSVKYNLHCAYYIQNI